MNNNIKKIAFGSAIFGLGAVTGYFISKKVLERQYRADVAEIQEFYKQKLDELGIMDADFELPDEEDEYSDSDEEDHHNPKLTYNHDTDPKNILGAVIVDTDKNGIHVRIKDELILKEGGRRKIINDYTKPSLETMKKFLDTEGISIVVEPNGDEHLGNIDDNEEETEYHPVDDAEYEAELEKMSDEYARRRSENMKRGEPYLIEPEEYHQGPEDYERQSLYYYSEDRTLCEDDDSKVDDEEECVGFDYEDKLDMQTTCWVRNDKLRVLYEIHRIDDSYTRAVAGMIETPREREFRVQGRRKRALDD